MANVQTTDDQHHSCATDELPQPQPQLKDTQVYSTFSATQRYGILAIVSTAGFLSTLSANIYFPALGVIQNDLHTSPELINLTVSLYMVFQGLSPSFWAPLADQWGRRPVYLATTTVYMVSNIALALTPNYPATLVFRMLQAFGSGPVIAIGAGCIGDIANPTERGTFFGVFSTGPQLAFVLGPTLGGIANSLGWRWIFWVLTLLGGILLITMTFLLRETLRSLVGDGSGHANPTPTQWLLRRRQGHVDSIDLSRFSRFPNILKPLTYAFQPDVGLCLVFNGMSYAVFYSILATYSRLLETVYDLNELYTGLCYIPTGIGCIVGSLLEGRILDRDFQIVAKQGDYDPKQLSRGNLDINFPIFHARLRTILIPHVIFDVTLLIYGFMVHIKAPLGVILLFQFIFGYSATSIFNIFHTLLVDLYPNNTASIAASNNIARCLLGAAVTAAIEPGIDAIGVQYMFLTLSLILMSSTVLIYVIEKYGPAWRRHRECLREGPNA